MLDKIKSFYKKGAKFLAPAFFALALNGSFSGAQEVNMKEKENPNLNKIYSLLQNPYFASFYSDAWLSLYPFLPEELNDALKFNTAFAVSRADKKVLKKYTWRLRALYGKDPVFSSLLDSAESAAFYGKDDDTIEALVAMMLSFNYSPEVENFLRENAKFLHVLSVTVEKTDYLFALFDAWGFSFLDERKKIKEGRYKTSVYDLYLKQSPIAVLYEREMKRRLREKFLINPNFVAQVVFSVARLAYTIEQAGFVDTEKAVKDAFTIYYQSIKESGREKVLKENTILIDNDEYWSNGQKRFGNKKMRDKISQKSRLIYFDGSPEYKKEQFFKVLLSQPNLTVFIDAHGNKEYFSLSSNPNRPIDVSAKEFAQVLYKRVKEYSLDAPVVINSSCFSYDFMLATLKELEKLGGVDSVPIFINRVESGQYGWGISSVRVQSFNNWVLSHDTLKELAKSNFEENAVYELMSNPSIFVPLRYKIPISNRNFKDKWMTRIMQLG